MNVGSNEAKFFSQASFIDKSLADLDILIQKKRENLQRMDEIRKSPSPVSFGIMTSDVHSHSHIPVHDTAISQEESSPDKENVHRNIVLKAPLSIKKVRPVLSARNLQQSPSVQKQNLSEQQQAQQEHEQIHAKVQQQLRETQDKLQQMQQDHQQQQQEADVHLKAATSRILELERDSNNNTAYIHKLDLENKEMSQVLEAQRSVIDALSLQRSLYASPEQSQREQVNEHQDQAQETLLGQNYSNKGSQSTNNITTSTTKRRLVRRKDTLSAADVDESTSNALLKQRSSEDMRMQAASTPQVQENSDDEYSGNPNSIFIIRQNMPSPSLQQQLQMQPMQTPLSVQDSPQANAQTYAQPNVHIHDAGLLASPQVLNDMVMMLGGTMLVSIVVCLVYVASH